MLNRTEAPPFIQARSFSLPSYHPISLKGGIQLFIIPDVQQEVVRIELLFQAGKWFEPKAGVSHFTTNMLEKGTVRQSSADLAEAFDRLGAHIEISAGYDNAAIGLYALKKNWKEAFSLIVEMVQTPSFEDKELALMKSIFVQNLKVNLEKNSFVASQVIRKNIYGDHPYGTSLEQKDLDGIDRKQLQDFKQKRFSPFAIFVTTHAGISQDEIVHALEPFTASPKEDYGTKLITPGAMNEQVEKEGSVQTSIRLGKRTVLRTDQEYPELLMFNQILGGYFGSRLMKNIREEKGLTYGIYSSMNPLLTDSFFIVGADVNRDNRDIALEEIRKEIQRLRTELIDQEELDIARNHFLGSLQSEVANPFTVSDKVKNIYLNNLPSDYYQQLFDQIRAITPRDLLHTGEKHFAIESLHVATVG